MSESNVQRTQSERSRKQVRIFDTTLRDGEQAPGIALTKAEKVEIAEQLARLNVDILEAGFPISLARASSTPCARSPRPCQGPVIAALARTATGDIERAAEALKGADRWRIHTFISHERRPARVDAEDELPAGARRDPRERDAREELHGRRRVLRAGRDAHRARLPARVLPRRRRVRRHHDQRARHGRVRDADGVRRADPHRARRDARRRRHLDALPQRPRASRSRTRWPASRTAPARSRSR